MYTVRGHRLRKLFTTQNISNTKISRFTVYNFAAASLQQSVQPSELCTLRMQGAYPTLIVADVQGQGSANLLSKMKLWSMLSIDQ